VTDDATGHQTDDATDNTTDEITVRGMRWWDVEPVLALERELFGPTAWTAESFWSELAHPQTRWYLVAQDGSDGGDGGTSSTGDIVGYAGLLTGGAEADVQTIAVAGAAQGRGLGTRLLTRLVDRAAECGATALLLEVRADNAGAIALYRRHGFEQIAVRRRYYQPGDIDALVMRRRPLQAPG
jgi:ribosomal-protein-alanine N-acetyltransferase